jgi:hypothetical protein
LSGRIRGKAINYHPQINKEEEGKRTLRIETMHIITFQNQEDLQNKHIKRNTKIIQKGINHQDSKVHIMRAILNNSHSANSNKI